LRPNCFTHVDPFEDTERTLFRCTSRSEASFTHVDPFEDTERHELVVIHITEHGFTHVDPFEDTESSQALAQEIPARVVSPTSIRSRILKGSPKRAGISASTGFTHVDPFEDTESMHFDFNHMRCLLFHPRRSVRGY